MKKFTEFINENYEPMKEEFRYYWAKPKDKDPDSLGDDFTVVREITNIGGELKWEKMASDELYTDDDINGWYDLIELSLPTNESINESMQRDSMISVIRNILKEIKKSSYISDRGRYLMMNHIIGQFAEKLFTNESDKNDFYYSIVEEEEKFRDV